MALINKGLGYTLLTEYIKKENVWNTDQKIKEKCGALSLDYVVWKVTLTSPAMLQCFLLKSKSLWARKRKILSECLLMSTEVRIGRLGRKWSHRPMPVLFHVSCSRPLCLKQHGSRQSALWDFQQKLFRAPFSKIHNDPAVTHKKWKSVAWTSFQRSINSTRVSLSLWVRLNGEKLW